MCRDRPRITRETIQFDKLLEYPNETLGRVYAEFMVKNVSERFRLYRAKVICCLLFHQFRVSLLIPD